MALTENVLKYSPEGVPDRLTLQCVLAALYATGGDTLNLNPSAFKDPNGKGLLGYPDALPKQVNVVNTNFTGAYALYQAYVVPGATLGTYKLQIANGGVELGAGAYPAGLLGQSVTLEVLF